MRRRSIFPCLVVFLFLLPACNSGSKECAGEHTGTWQGVTVSDQLVLTSGCGFRYTGYDSCQTMGTYAEPLAQQGSVQVQIESSTGGACLAAGTYTCAYDLSGDTLTFNCGAGAFVYSR